MVVGVGVLPNTDLAAAAGLDVDNGIVTDQYLTASAPGIYAAGDVASAWHPAYGARIRLEHWSSALNQGPVAARNMLGRVTPYDKVPDFYSDQYDLGMEYRGWAPHHDQVVFRGDVEGRESIAFWLQDGKVAAAMNAYVWDQGEAIEALLTTGRMIDPSTLRDLDVELSSLTAAS